MTQYSTTDTEPSASKKKVWDLPIRIFHWLLVLLIAGCWWTAENQYIEYHTFCAYALMALIIFRIYWGFFGSFTARFSQFIKKPSTALHYAAQLPRREVKPSLGHNPIGGYSVLAFLLVISVQLILGLFAIDIDGFYGGPFADYLSFDTAREFTHWHGINFNVLLTLIGLHLSAIFYYLVWRKNNLTATMIHGRPHESIPSDIPPTQHLVLKFFVGLTLSIGLVYLVVS